jgi:hypothetical protein
MIRKSTPRLPDQKTTRIKQDPCIEKTAFLPGLKRKRLSKISTSLIAEMWDSGTSI